MPRLSDADICAEVCLCLGQQFTASARSPERVEIAMSLVRIVACIHRQRARERISLAKIGADLRGQATGAGMGARKDMAAEAGILAKQARIKRLYLCRYFHVAKLPEIKMPTHWPSRST